MASPELAYYDAGMSVNYDRLVTADGHTWLSYMSAMEATRRYVAIDAKATTAVSQPASPSLAATGTYTFTKPSSIKGSTKRC